MKRSFILGLTMSGHGFSGALCIDGVIVAATTLERLTRKKYDILLPISRADLETFGWNEAPEIYKKNLDLPFDLEKDYTLVDFDESAGLKALLGYLLETGGIGLSDLTCVAYSYRHNDSMRRFFAEHSPSAEFVTCEHHLAHACQAFLSSPHEEAAIMIVDGQGVPLARTDGDQLSGCLAYGEGTAITTLYDLPVAHSLGGMYAAFTHKIGFQTNEEGKTMGLAPYGGPEYYDVLKKEMKFNTTDWDIRTFVA